jgi:hypothetical protein
MSDRGLRPAASLFESTDSRSEIEANGDTKPNFPGGGYILPAPPRAVSTY